MLPQNTKNLQDFSFGLKFYVNRIYLFFFHNGHLRFQCGNRIAPK